jgi:hypothetical protein
MWTREWLHNIKINMTFNTYDNVYQGTSVTIQSLTGSTAVTGSAFDTEGYDNAVMHVRAESPTGSPSAATVLAQLYECATSGGSYTQALDNTGTVIGFTLNNYTAAADGFARIEGLGINRLRFLKIKVTPAFTSGSSPASPVFAEFIACPRSAEPVRTAVSNT